MQRKTQDVERNRGVAEDSWKNKKYKIEEWPKKTFCWEEVVTVFEPHEKDIIITEKGKREEGERKQHPTKQGHADQDCFFRVPERQDVSAIPVGLSCNQVEESKEAKNKEGGLNTIAFRPVPHKVDIAQVDDNPNKSQGEEEFENGRALNQPRNEPFSVLRPFLRKIRISFLAMLAERATF